MNALTTCAECGESMLFDEADWRNDEPYHAGCAPVPALATPAPAAEPATDEMDRRQRMPKAHLSATLREMAALIDQDDSFEGSIAYEETEADAFLVGGCYRFGNSEGQGGMRLLDGVGSAAAAPPSAPPEGHSGGAGED